jgi:hypothetical protein
VHGRIDAVQTSIDGLRSEVAQLTVAVGASPRASNA